MPTIHRSVLGSAAVTASLPFFLDDPKRYWFLALVIGGGLALVFDDMLYYLSDGKYCLLCNLISPGRPA
jgi:hypothetical protein